MYDIQKATNQLLDVNFHENQGSIQATESGFRSECESLLVTITGMMLKNDLDIGCIAGSKKHKIQNP